MPVAPTAHDQVLEAVFTGPDGANRLYICTGVASGIVSSLEGQMRQTWTFLVGPSLGRRQFIRAIGTASIDQQMMQLQGSVGSFNVGIPSVEADWDDESSRAEVKVEISVQGSQDILASVELVRYGVTILAEV